MGGAMNKGCDIPVVLHKPIYMDYQASTPITQYVMDAMLPYFTEKFGNPHSKICTLGHELMEAVRIARARVAGTINASPTEIIFTSGATESNNIAIQGVMRYYSKNHGKNHIITSSIEHKAVLSVCEALQANAGCTLTILPVNKDGLIDVNKLHEAINSNTALVSIMMLNNETGVIQDIKQICDICQEKGVLFHTDAAQAFGKIPIDVQENKIDLLSISGHKIYGPKGVGALYMRQKSRIRMTPIYLGGGQERGLRAGTLATPLIVGLGAAAEEAQNHMHLHYKHITDLSQKFIRGLNTIPQIYYNAMPHTQHFPGCINVSFAGVEGEALLQSISPYICASTSSACNSDSIEASHVLTAIALPKHLLNTAIRFGIGRMTTEIEIDLAVKTIIREVKKLRAISPIWDMLNAGLNPDDLLWDE